MSPVIKDNYCCELCNKNFCSTSSLNRHKRNVHDEKKDRNVYICDCCQKSSYSRRIFLEHWRNIHRSKSGIRKSSPETKCPVCGIQIEYANIQSHLTHKHELNIEEKEYLFQDEESFYKWKKNTEKKKFSKFNIQVTRRNRTIRKYVCHRSGTFTSKSKGMRFLKAQGSKKIGGICPASMNFSKLDNGLIRVKFVRTHVGHDYENDLRHLKSSPKRKPQVVEQLIREVPKRTILQNVVNDVNREINIGQNLSTEKELQSSFLRIFDKAKHIPDARLFLSKLLKDAERKIDLFVQTHEYENKEIDQ